MATEFEQVQAFITEAKFPGLRQNLERYAQSIANSPASASSSQSAPDIPPAAPVNVAASNHVAVAAAAPARASISLSRPIAGKDFVPVETFSWDQGEYNSPTITIYVDIDGVGRVKDAVTCDFGLHSFDLKVMGLNGINYRLLKDNLEKDIVPGSSKFIVKRDKVVIKLQKVKGEYSYENWGQLTAKKSREESAQKKKDPMGGIMDMMKDMYEEGDDSMKKIIGEAMLKSQRGEKAEPPTL